MENIKKNNTITYLFLGILLLLFTVLPIKNILLGVYKWHIQQPESWQGGIEISIFMFLITCVLNFSKERYKSFLLWGIIAIYFMLNGVIIPVIVGYLYLEAVKNIGRVTKNKLHIEMPLNNHIIDFIVGMVIVSFSMIIMSLFGLGSIFKLTVLVILLTFISLCIDHKAQLLIIDINSYIKREKNLINYVLVSFLIGLVLVQFAKSNRAIDYDSIWYGLRPKDVLFGENSFYDNLGLVGFVYYYPKLMELFYAPISGFTDYSFIYSFNICILGMLILLTYSFIRRLQVDKQLALIAIACIFSIPAIIGMGPTAKTDIFTSFLILLAHNLLYEYLINRDERVMILGVGVALLSYGGKPTSLLYTTLLLMTFFIIVGIKFISRKIVFEKSRINKGIVVLVSMMMLVVLGIVYRTYLLTGYPTYKTGANIWEKLGFVGNYPFYGSDEMGLTEVKVVTLKQALKRVYQALFNPKDLGHVIMTWVGNIYIFYLIMLIILKKYIRVDNKIKYILALNSLLFLSGLYYLITMPIPDGNYFIIQIINILVLIFYLFSTIKVKSIYPIIKVTATTFIILQFAIMFVSHWSWSWGTRKFDINVLKSNFDTTKVNVQLFKDKGIHEIYSYLENVDIRIIASGDENILHRIPKRVEVLNNVASNHIGNPNILNSYEDFKEFINWSGVTGFIIDKADDRYPQYNEYIEKLNLEYETIEIDDVNYKLVVINK